MAPNDGRPVAPNQRTGANTNNGSKNPINRVKMLIATGAVASTLGGWALLAGQNAASAGQAPTNPTPTAIVSQLNTATATPTAQATATLTTAAPASTPTAQATATTAAYTATPTTQATATTAATDTPQPTATKSAPTATPKAVTTTKSSR
jgi:hypothetical protein